MSLELVMKGHIIVILPNQCSFFYCRVDGKRCNTQMSFSIKSKVHAPYHSSIQSLLFHYKPLKLVYLPLSPSK